MFLPNDLLHIVFANEGDTYYCNTLMKLDLNQYLWFTLHEKYSSVYFMEDNDGDCDFYSYGDASADTDKTKKSIWGKHPKKFRTEMMLSALEQPSDRAAAFVCPMNDFCKIFDTKTGSKLLSSFANSGKRTGIIVLTAPPETDYTRNLLMESPVFEYLKEPWVKAVRSDTSIRMYDTIKNLKPLSCVNLNYFSKASILDLLSRVMMEDSSRFLLPEDLVCVVNYLYQYLNNWTFRIYETTLPDNQLDYRTKYSDLYRYCKNKDIWKKLIDRSLEIGRAGGTERYLETIKCPVREDTDQLKGKNFYRMPNTYAEDFLRYCSTSQFNIISGDNSDVRAEVLRQITAIRKEIIHIRNGFENKNIVAKADAMTTKLKTYSGYKDVISNIYTLRALNFIMTNITVPEKSEKESKVIEIADSYDDLINTSLNLFVAQRDLTAAKANAVSEMSKKILEQSEKKVRTLKDQEKFFSDKVNASVTMFNIKYTPAKVPVISTPAEEPSEIKEPEPVGNELKQEDAAPEIQAEFNWDEIGRFIN